MSGERDLHHDKLHLTLINASTAESSVSESVIARLATEFWRLGRRAALIADVRDSRPLLDSLQRIADVFAEHRIGVVDHDGGQYDPGLQVEVLHQREGSGNLEILETVRPTITINGRVVQQAQVVVGPREHEDTEARS